MGIYKPLPVGRQFIGSRRLFQFFQVSNGEAWFWCAYTADLVSLSLPVVGFKPEKERMEKKKMKRERKSHLCTSAKKMGVFFFFFFLLHFSLYSNNSFASALKTFILTVELAMLIGIYLLYFSPLHNGPGESWCLNWKINLSLVLAYMTFSNSGHSRQFSMELSPHTVKMRYAIQNRIC